MRTWTGIIEHTIPLIDGDITIRPEWSGGHVHDSEDYKEIYAHTVEESAFESY
jgi:hypothetical protein